MPRPSALLLAFAVPCSLAASACGDPAATPAADPNAEPAPPSCARGEVAGIDGCMPVGIRGCAPPFLGDDGLCHPRMAQCPNGTIPKLDEGCVAVGIQRCSPIFLADDGLCRPSMAKCADQPGTFAVPQEGCVPIDGPSGCGAAPWGELPDAPDTVYVDKTAPAEGTGTRDSPMRSIAQAMTRVRPGGTLALAAGTYDEGILIDKVMHVIGRCPSLVRIQGIAGSDVPAAIHVNGARRVTIARVGLGGPGMGLAATAGAQVALDHVHIRGATNLGVLVADVDSEATVAHSLIEDTALPSSGEGFGEGAQVHSGGRLTVENSAIVRNRDMGIYMGARGEALSVVGSLIEDTRQKGDYGFGIGLQNAGEVTVSDTAIVGNRIFGVLIEGGGTKGTLRGNLIAGTLPQEPEGTWGVGVFVEKGAHVSLSGNAIVDNRTTSVFAGDAGTEMEMAGDLVANTLPQAADSKYGLGIFAQDGARISVASSAVVGNRETGIFSSGNGAAVDVRSTLVERTLPRDIENELGTAVDARDGATLSVSGSALIESYGVSATVHHGGAQLTIDATLIEDTRPQRNDRRNGRGIEAHDEGVLTMTGSLVEQSRGFGVVAVNTAATISKSLVRDTRAEEASNEWGVAVICLACELKLSDSIARESYVAGVMVNGGKAEIDRVLIEGVAAGAWTPLTSGERIDDAADGIDAVERSHVVVTGTRVTRAARAGLLFLNSSGRISGTEITRNRFGLVLQGTFSPQVDDDNVFEDNTEGNFLGGDLAVPSVPTSIPD